MTNLQDKILNFLDIETTGGNYNIDKIIEIYISKVKNGKEIDKFYTKVNPGFRPNPFILRLTNIDYSELEEAPNFEDVADDLYEFLNDGIFIAHNARFDYSFIKNQLKDYGYIVNLDYCCSVKVSRFLYPRYKSHNLDSIINRFGFSYGARHRADFDTEVIKLFFDKARHEHGNEKFEQAFNYSIKQAAVPVSLNKFISKDIPETSGVYIFYDENNYPIYIGMSKNLRRRINEHFYQDLTNSKDLRINQLLKKIEFIETAGTLGAYIRESILVKKYQPLYNRKLRDNRILIKLEHFIDDDGYMNARIDNDSNMEEVDFSKLIGVFRSKQDLKDRLNGFVKEYGLCPKLLGLEKSKGACFSYQLEQCKGACTHKITPQEYNRLFEMAFRELKLLSWPTEEEIIVTESNNNLTEQLTFNKWKLVKSSIEDQIFEFADKTKFDLDMYNIIHRYFRENQQMSELS